MLHIEKMKEILKDRLTEKRYIHSLGVQESAIKLAKIYNVSIEKASIAALVHDCAKDLSEDMLLNYAKQFDILVDSVESHQIGLLHGCVGAELVKIEFGIEDSEIINAIRFHTTGKENMTILEKIIYLADYIEPNRSFNGVDQLRKTALSNLDKAVIMAFDKTINYVIQKGELLHPTTIVARNFLLLQT
ncbi:bis(5'-nucleosyl)-tetraphosphatase (symmetrical) YqeK [Marinisporobacter balticus]|uniref:bis(5'-nucleosyl)-tetraphosphatase (symmetrical) n=1 Tax=Marinisporobacter balticus TaxID=2018667 RepID=A0A4R2KYA9_9FIRM|nr:bis(5'-nucleosyl)-tetraphosphatase (symmetrical) YqeK [Marinisporobacter balticus]TCO79024.1 putative HD superfamily hydrolase involved in NAD metabolism [Marinisporobacter balticus]